MTSGWVALLGTLVPLALVVAASPLSVIPPVLLVLHTSRPRSTGLAFLCGWLAGLAAVVTLFVQVPHLFGGEHQSTPGWTAWVRIGFGVLLLVFGGWRWVTRKKSAAASTWLTKMQKITPLGAAVIGVVLVVINPKLVLICAAAGLAVGTAGLSTAGAAVGVACFTTVAGSTAAIPIIAYAVATERIDPQLEKFKAWIERHQAAITAGILVVVGAVLTITGLLAL